MLLPTSINNTIFAQLTLFTPGSWLCWHKPVEIRGGGKCKGCRGGKNKGKELGPDNRDWLGDKRRIFLLLFQAMWNKNLPTVWGLPNHRRPDNGLALEDQTKCWLIHLVFLFSHISQTKPAILAPLAIQHQKYSVIWTSTYWDYIHVCQLTVGPEMLSRISQ